MQAPNPKAKTTHGRGGRKARNLISRDQLGTTWSEAVAATRAEWCAELHSTALPRHEVARRYRHRALPQDLHDANMLVRLAEKCRERLEWAFLAPDHVDTERTYIDPVKDVPAARHLVTLLLNAARSHGTGSSVVLRGSEIHGAYAELPSAEQRRHRIAFMRYVDLCTRLGFGRISRTEDDLPKGAGARRRFIVRSAVGYELPFAMGEFAPDDLETLHAVWPDKSGAKRTGSKKPRKWTFLADVLGRTWGCTSSARALESEYERYVKNPRRRPR
jgi:hypothetical protein